MIRPRAAAPLLAGLGLALSACPEERGDTRRQVPAARVPAAVPVEASPLAVPAPAPEAKPAEAEARPGGPKPAAPTTSR